MGGGNERNLLNYRIDLELLEEEFSYVFYLHDKYCRLARKIMTLYFDHFSSSFSTKRIQRTKFCSKFLTEKYFFIECYDMHQEFSNYNIYKGLTKWLSQPKKIIWDDPKNLIYIP